MNTLSFKPLYFSMFPNEPVIVGSPLPQVKKDFPELDRKVTRREYQRLVSYALELGVENAFIQEGKTAEESFIPMFDYEGVRN